MGLPMQEPPPDVGHAVDAPPPEVLRSLVAGDRDALEHVAELYWPRIRRWAYLELGDASLAEDAAQEALIRLIRFAPRYDPARPFTPWLRSIVRNAARDQRPLVRRVLDFFRPRQERPPDTVVDLARASKRAASTATPSVASKNTPTTGQKKR